MHKFSRLKEFWFNQDYFKSLRRVDLESKPSIKTNICLEYIETDDSLKRKGHIYFNMIRYTPDMEKKKNLRRVREYVSKWITFTGTLVHYQSFDEVTEEKLVPISKVWFDTNTSTGEHEV
jgi:hypothetical protein